jgi:hypothetical protein
MFSSLEEAQSQAAKFDAMIEAEFTKSAQDRLWTTGNFYNFCRCVFRGDFSFLESSFSS